MTKKIYFIGTTCKSFQKLKKKLLVPLNVIMNQIRKLGHLLINIRKYDFPINLQPCKQFSHSIYTQIKAKLQFEKFVFSISFIIVNVFAISLTHTNYQIKNQ